MPRRKQEDRSPRPGAVPSSYMCEVHEYKDRWGTIRYGTSEQWNDGSVIRHIDAKALARIAKRQKRLADRVRLAVKGRKSEHAWSTAGVSARRKKTEALDDAARKYRAQHPRCSVAQLARHLAPQYRPKGMSNPTWHARVRRCLDRIEPSRRKGSV